MATSRWRLRVALFLAVGLGITGIWLVAYGTKIFEDLDLDSVDARFSIRGVEERPADIVIVKVDDVTFNELNRRWEEFRPFHAQVIRRLAEDGATVIAYDVQFTEPSGDPDADSALIEAVEAAGNVVLATTEVGPNGETRVFGGDDVVREIGARVGNANFPADPGGFHRRMDYEIDKLESFAVATVERETGKPVQRFDRTWIDYRGPVDTFRAVSFSQVARGQFEKGLFRGKIAIVGPWAPTFQDLHPVSFGDDQMPGPEIQANAIQTIRRGLPLASVPGGLDVGLIVLLGMVAPLSGLVFALRGTLIVAISSAVGLVGGTLGAFELGWINSFVYPFGVLAMSSVGAVGAHYLLAAFERERVRDIFARFVPAAVVDDVLKRTDGDLRLGGVTMEATVMFTDLRGFTSVSEALPAAEVIQIVNHYLEEMTKAIHAHGGTLVSYEGDGIMAVFGAPLEQPDHADRAIATAREMLETRLPRFNQWLEEREIASGFYMGIGLNSGDVVSGNVGAENRVEYAAIGDTTNTAARLQGMTKGTLHSVFISDSTRLLCQEEVPDLVFVDEMEVRGRQAKVKLWSLPVGVKGTAHAS